MFLKFARKVAHLLGHPITFTVALLSILGWLSLGPSFNWNADWQLWVNTLTTIFTFLIVIILQHSDNDNTEQLDKKLNTIISLISEHKLSSSEKKLLNEHIDEIIEETIDDLNDDSDK